MPAVVSTVIPEVFIVLYLGNSGQAAAGKKEPATSASVRAARSQATGGGQGRCGGGAARGGRGTRGGMRSRKWGPFLAAKMMPGGR